MSHDITCKLTVATMNGRALYTEVLRGRPEPELRRLRGERGIELAARFPNCYIFAEWRTQGRGQPTVPVPGGPRKFSLAGGGS